MYIEQNENERQTMAATNGSSNKTWTIVVTILVLLILIIGGVGAYYAYLGTQNNTNNNSSQNNSTSDTNELLTFSDKDVTLKFKYDKTLSVNASEVALGEDPTGELSFKSKTVTIMDRDNNTLVLTYNNQRIECTEPYLIQELKDGGKLIGTSSISNLPVYLYQDTYIALDESNATESICNDTIVGTVNADLTLKDSGASTQLFNDLVLTIDDGSYSGS